MRTRYQPLAMSLFPFLAVLICAMGALIFLLLVITRMIREDVYAAEAQALESAVVEVAPAVPALASPPEEPQTPPTPEIVLPDTIPELTFPNIDLTDLELQVAQLKQQVGERQARVDDNTSQLNAISLQINSQQQLVSVKQSELQARTRRQTENQQAAQSLAATGEQQRQNLLSAQAQLEALAQKKTALQAQRQQLLEGLAESTGQLAQAQAQAEKMAAALEDKQATLKSAMDGYEIIPVDSKTGTSRYPILIECTRQGLEFRPEGLFLGPVDMKGFTPGFNPLLAGTKALMNYWEAQAKSGGQRPYILLIVRPSGIESFYAARRYLQPLENELGYELISDNLPLAIPPLSEGAKEVLERAVRESLQARNQLAETVISPIDGSFPQLLSESDRAFEPRAKNAGGPGTAGRGNSATQLAADPNARHFDQTSSRAATDESRENNTNSTAFSQIASSQRGGSPGAAQSASTTPGSSSPSFSSPTVRPGASASSTEQPSWEQVAKEAGSNSNSDAAPESIARMLAKSGMTNRAGQIGIEKKVNVYLDADQMQFNDNRPVSLANIQSSEQFKKIFWAMLEEQVASWKSPPNGFYWTPSVKFFVSPGGNRHYTRIESALKTLRIPVTVEQRLETGATVATPDLEESFR